MAVVIVVATWQVYDNSRLFMSVNRASEQLIKRRDVVDSLVCSLLETSNAERSVLLGDSGEWRRFDSSVTASERMARRLKLFIADRVQRQRIDTLVQLMHRKRDNTQLVTRLLSADGRDAFYRNKVASLHSGRDSVIIRPNLYTHDEQHERVYEIIKSKRGFFRRLGDAFRRQHSDTVGVTNISHVPTTDSTGRKINIADSVANILAAIRKEEQRHTDRRQETVAVRLARLQRTSVQLSRRTGMLLEDIQHDEQQALQRALAHAMHSRRTMAVRMAVTGLLAVMITAILVAYILRDIKRERRDRERIVAAKTETERIMQQRERLLLTITHDIKAPAASIAGFIDLLAEYVDRPKAMTYIDSMRHSALHLQQLVAALLDYHLLESGKAERHDVSFVPRQLADSCVSEFRPIAAAKGLTVTYDSLSARCNSLWQGDAFRIRQIMSNLIGNAIKYTDHGGVTVETDISPRQHLIIKVTDTGCGMSEADCRRIFDAFTRLPGAQGKEGVGLGLSITREVVQLLGGIIRVISRQGNGSCFVVSLPVGQADDTNKVHDGGSKVSAVSENSMTASSANEKESVSTSAPVTVLAVDDDPLQLELFREMMQKISGATFSVSTITSATKAIQMAKAAKPQIMFTDIEMPEMSGSDMLKSLPHAHTSVVAMTAHDKSIMPSLRSAGFCACLFKPFSAATLAATLSQVTGLALGVQSVRSEDTFFAPLTAFAEGDAEAEREILSQVAASVAEYRSVLAEGIKCADDDAKAIALVSRAAHKAMPLLAMLKPGQCGWLQKITPEHIKATPSADRNALARRLEKELEELARRLN